MLRRVTTLTNALLPSQTTTKRIVLVDQEYISCR